MDIRAEGITEIYSLGDSIGYGPNPRECLDLVMRFKVAILGNHDQAAMVDPKGFNAAALEAAYWTRDQLESGPGNTAMINRRWDFLGELPTHYLEEPYLFVHGSPRDPTNEYVFPEDIFKPQKIDALFNALQKRGGIYSFQGHTHIPGLFTPDYQFVSPEDCDGYYKLGGTPALINVGSVGQPRDGDPRACYTILDTDSNSLQFKRVEYPKETTREKIMAIESLSNLLGDRLISGR